MNIVDANIDQIKSLCIKHSVDKLFVFGSILTNQFNDSSDIDFLVDFKNMEVRSYADNYFDLKFSLEAMLHRNVDLIEEKAIKNPFFMKSIDSTKQLIYGRVA